MSNNKVIVVDDEAIILRQFKSYLERKGYVIFAVSSGEEALNLIRQENPDLMILDLHLTDGLQGADVLKHSLQIKPSLKIAIHSGIGEDKDAQNMCLNMGAKVIFPKPMTLAEIKEGLDKLKNGSFVNNVIRQ